MTKFPQYSDQLFIDDAIAEDLSDFQKEAILGYDEKYDVVKRWISEIESNKLEQLNEDEVKPRFITEIFGDVLGYDMAGPKEWNLRQEFKSVLDATKADAALGFFKILDSGISSIVHAVIEVKGPGADLDKRSKKKVSAVKQAFDYAVINGAKWVIATNFNEIRLYDSRNIKVFESFKLAEFHDEQKFIKFLFLLHRTGLIHSKKSKAQRLLQDNEVVTERKTKRWVTDQHIIDRVFNCLAQFQNLGFIDPNYISNLSPFSILNEHVWHYSNFTLFTLNSEIHHLLTNLEIDNNSVRFTPQYEEELLKGKVVDAKKKVEQIFVLLNRCLIHSIAAIKDYKSIEARNRRPNVFGFSLRHIFHFDDEKDGIVKKIVINQEVCTCISCALRSMDLKRMLIRVRDGLEKPTLETAYGAYLAVSDNFLDAYKLYKSIALASDDNAAKKVEYFIAQHNLKALRNLVTHFHPNDERIKKHLKSLDLEEILWVHLDNLPKDVRNLLREIRDHSFQQSIIDNVSDTLDELLKVSSHYKSGGTYLGVGNLTAKLLHDFYSSYAFYNRNFLIGDCFSKYRSIVADIFRGLVLSHSLEKYPHRLKKFDTFILVEVVLHVDPATLSIIVNESEKFELSKDSQNEFLLRVRTFLSSFISDPNGDNEQESMIFEFVSNYDFEQKCKHIFSNFFILLSHINLEVVSWPRDIADLFIKFLKCEKFLYGYHLKYFSEFLRIKGQIFSIEQLFEMLSLAIERNTIRTNKYQKLVGDAAHAIETFYPNSKLNDENILELAFVNATSDSGRIDFQFIFELWPIVGQVLQKSIKLELENSLNKHFSGDLYESALREKVLSFDEGDFFEKYVQHINRVKGKGFVGVVGENAEYEDLYFENFALLIYYLEIPFSDPRLKSLTNLSSYETWLINPVDFDYSDFDPQWLHATSNYYFIERLKGIGAIMGPLREHLFENYNERLSKIYFQILKE